MTEHSEVQYGTTRIPFEIRRSPRRSTVALTIDTARLVVTAPEAATVERLNALVRAKGLWVVQQLRAERDLVRPLAVRQHVDGASVLYVGRHYRLRLVPGAEEPSRVLGGWYELRVPEGRRVPPARATGALLAASLRQRAEVYLPRRMDALCARLRQPAPELLVRDQRKRWGSCDARGVLRINWRIVQAPVALIDYVLVHELVHRDHPSHDRAFWAQLGRWMPDFDRRRRRLLALGPELELERDRAP